MEPQQHRITMSPFTSPIHRDIDASFSPITVFRLFAFEGVGVVGGVGRVVAG